MGQQTVASYGKAIEANTEIQALVSNRFWQESLKNKVYLVRQYRSIISIGNRTVLFLIVPPLDVPNMLAMY